MASALQSGPAKAFAEPVDPPPRLPEAKEVIESKIILCERCGTVVVMLIFAPRATDPVRFEDYARKMYPQYNRLNVPTWIIGPALGEGPLYRAPSRTAKSVAEAGANPTVGACAIQSAPRSARYQASPLTP